MSQAVIPATTSGSTCWAGSYSAGEDGPEPGLYWVAKPNRALKAEEFLRFLDALPRLPVLRVVVLDNGSLHCNDLVKAALPDLWTKGIYLYYLPLIVRT